MKRMSKGGLMVFLIGLVLIAGLPPVSAYETIDVSNGGALAGKIILKGKRPAARVFALVNYPFGFFCKKISDGSGHVRLRDFIVRKDGGLWEAVVALKDVKRGKPYRPTVADFVATDCMFHPAEVADNEMFFVDEAGQMHHEHPNVAIIHNHQRMNMINRDPVVHNIQVFQNEKGNIILNTPLPVSDHIRGGVLHYKRGKRISQMICGMHEFMQSWGFVVDNPYYAKTAKDGTYRIDGIPPGTYTVSIWHPHYKVYEQKVTIRAGETARLDFAFDASIIKNPVYESQKRFRIDTATPESSKLHEGDDRVIID